MSKYPEHNQEFFYKFTTMETAHLILESGNFRYSSPSSFNDPFDIQTELYFEFDISDLPNMVANAIDELVCGHRVQDLEIQPGWQEAIRLLQEQDRKGNYRREHLEFLVKPLAQGLTEIIEDTKIECNEHWGKLLKTMRVFCVSEYGGSILMWSHYASYHTGVCFKLKVLPETDNPLCVAQKVDYLSDPPSFFNAEEWVESIVLGKKMPFTDLHHRYPISKSNIWEYEKEWRVWAPLAANNDNHVDVPIAEGEIEAIYFGVNANQNMVNSLIRTAKTRNIQHFFESEKKVLKYSLTYKKITNR